MGADLERRGAAAEALWAHAVVAYEDEELLEAWKLLDVLGNIYEISMKYREISHEIDGNRWK